jgi:hypothetical protein
MDKMNGLNLIGGIFESDLQSKIYYNRIEYTLNGRMDYVDINLKKIFEFKCKNELHYSDYIQLMIYKYIYERTCKIKMSSYIFNIITGQYQKVDANNKDIEESIIELIMLKQYENITNDEDFKNNCHSIIRRIFNIK